MTRNVYLGADLQDAIGALAFDPDSVPAAVGQVWATVQATDFETRAQALAAEIEEQAPDLVGLQEVAMWRTQYPSDALAENPRRARRVRFDFLKILHRALRERGLRYRTVAVSRNFDHEMPGIAEEGLTDIRLTDRDVILARRGVAASRRRHGTFQAAMVLPVGEGLPVARGWAAVDARVNGTRFRFVSTHLEDGVEEVQRAQIAELLAGPAATDLPVVLAGDFNSDPLRGYSPLVHADALEAGFSDAWTEVNPGDQGLTWGHLPTLDNPSTAFTYRLDYVFLRGGAAALTAVIVGEEPEDLFEGLWPSDHAGVIAWIEFTTE